MLNVLKSFYERFLDYLVDFLTEDEIGHALTGQRPVKVPKNLVVIEVEGGLVQLVRSNAAGIDVRVLDRDNIRCGNAPYASDEEQEQDVLGFALDDALHQLPIVW